MSYQLIPRLVNLSTFKQERKKSLMNFYTFWIVKLFVAQSGRKGWHSGNVKKIQTIVKFTVSCWKKKKINLRVIEFDTLASSYGIS